LLSIVVQQMIESSQELQTRNILNANQFNCVRKIGKGGFGHVMLATKATSSSSYYAIKCLSKKKMIKDPQLKKGLVQEINTMASL
jgi:serine/threonine protein kinase